MFTPKRRRIFRCWGCKRITGLTLGPVFIRLDRCGCDPTTGVDAAAWDDTVRHAITEIRRRRDLPTAAEYALGYEHEDF